MGTPPRAADEIPTPRGQVRTKGVLRPRYCLPFKSSKWGQMHTELLVGSADEPAAGFQGDTGAFISPLARTTAESGAKVTRMHEIFTQKITKIYENRTKATISLANTSLHDVVIKQGFLEVCEGERASVGKGLRNSAPMQLQRMWVSLSASKGLLVYDPHTQDLLDPVQTIAVKSILHCKAEDTCVFSVESMIDDFLGSWSFFFRAESRGERDAWITGIDRQIVGQSPMTNAHSRSFHRTLASPTSSKVQSPVSVRNSLKISSLISPRSASSANNHQVMSPKRRRFLDDSDAELRKMRQIRENTETFIGEVQETLQELEQMRNVLWCKDIASVLTAQKIRANFQVKADKGRDAAAVKALIQVSGSRSDLTGDDMVIVSPSGRLGCMVVFNTEIEAKKAIQAISFHAGHDGETLTSQLISEDQIVSTASQFSSDSDLQAPSPGSKSASHPVVSGSGGHEKDEDERQQPKASDAKGALVSHSATGMLQTRTSNSPAGWSFQNEKMISSIAQRRQKKELQLHQKRSTQSQGAASAKLLRALSSSSSKKVELHALMPNQTVFSYFLIRYNPVQSSIEMEYVTNEKTHSLWTGAITDLAVAPTGTGGNVSVLGGGQCAVQVGQRHWDQFASLAKTTTLMIQALDKHMIDPLDLERHTAKYTNIQEPVSDRIFVGKARQQAARHWTEARKSITATTSGENAGVSSPRATLETDTATLMIGMHDFSEILAELSEVPKEKVVVNQNVDPEVLTLVADIAEACTELPDDAGYDFTTTWLNSIVQSDDARSPKEKDEDEANAVKTIDNENLTMEITVKPIDNPSFKLPHLDKNTANSHHHTELTTVPATQKPRKTSTHTRPKLVPPLRIPAVVHGGRVDTWDHRTRHDGLTNPHLKLDPAQASTRSYTARISTHEDAETKNL